jgi:hypothetical protein
MLLGKNKNATAVLKGQSVYKKLPVKPAVTDSGNTSATHGDLENTKQKYSLGVVKGSKWVGLPVTTEGKVRTAESLLVLKLI